MNFLVFYGLTLAAANGAASLHRFIKPAYKTANLIKQQTQIY
jgi:hypothetical protein